MPELPEVEVLRRSLEGLVLGRRIVRARALSPALREPLRQGELRKLVDGRRIIALRRRSKYLLLDLERDATLVVHLGMSGRLTLDHRANPRLLHEHVVLDLDDDEQLRFRDPRRFGLVFALPTQGLASDRHFVRLGAEPLDAAFQADDLWRSGRRRRTSIKALLMDAGVMVGVGNIYASEALHLAGIDPRRQAARVSRMRYGRLLGVVREVLERAIASGGTTLNDFADAVGEPGYFSVSLAVYDREGETCLRCGGVVRRIVQGNRSTYFCPRCQR
ncbi:MAG TPA: bifunctional DNA-formamidopyrimidine glycosylase/DNA-(apurinic or apyrimidinic site) lyase [Thermoanaerobaculia bacterium]|nr:bifunctional DNA-formamidopyrimidine glycosylase/DNA-(apurinic or apyrimidinic site) lyase [Thermoanaerobaculia bacterium]